VPNSCDPLGFNQRCPTNMRNSLPHFLKVATSYLSIRSIRYSYKYHLLTNHLLPDSDGEGRCSPCFDPHYFFSKRELGKFYGISLAYSWAYWSVWTYLGGIHGDLKLNCQLKWKHGCGSFTSAQARKLLSQQYNTRVHKILSILRSHTLKNGRRYFTVNSKICHLPCREDLACVLYEVLQGAWQGQIRDINIRKIHLWQCGWGKYNSNEAKGEKLISCYEGPENPQVLTCQNNLAGVRSGFWHTRY